MKLRDKAYRKARKSKNLDELRRAKGLRHSKRTQRGYKTVYQVRNSSSARKH